MKVSAHLHYAKTGGVYGGVYAGAPAQEARDGASNRFTFSIAAKEGLESVSLVVFLSPTGDFKDRTALVFGPSIPVKIPGAVDAPGKTATAPIAPTTLFADPVPLLDSNGKKGTWCDLRLLSAPRLGKTLRVALRYGPLTEKTPLHVDLHWRDVFGDYRGHLVASTRGELQVEGQGQLDFDFPLPERPELRGLTVIVFLGEKRFFSEKLTLPAEGLSALPAMDAAWGKTPEGNWNWNAPQAKVMAGGDYEWQPRPFVYRKGRGVRYIDFEGGDDANDGESAARPWKHHPWDPKAAGRSHLGGTADTFVFKRGAIYRGTLVASPIGAEGQPIRLTSDPSWGSGEAWLYGSERLQGTWRKLEEDEIPQAREREKIWCLPMGTESVPRALWELRGGKAVRLNLARTPNWAFKNPDDLRADWGVWKRVEPAAVPKRFLGVDSALDSWPPGSLQGALVYCDYPGVVGRPTPNVVLGNSPDGLSFHFQRNPPPVTGCRYFIEGAPVLLDEPGEFWFDAKAGRLYARMPGDRDPASCVLEAAIRPNMIVLADPAHVEVSGLSFAFANAGDPMVAYWSPQYRRPGCVVATGRVEDIRVAHCRFEQVVCGFLSEASHPGAVHDRIAIEDNDIADAELGGVHILDAYRFNQSAFTPPIQVWRVKVMRNRILRAGLGFRPVESFAPAIWVEYPRLCEVAGNWIEDAGASGIIVVSGKSDGYLNDFREVPLVRTLVYQNHVVRALQTTCDYGGIATWQLGPAYVFNNLSGNPLGPKRLYLGQQVPGFTNDYASRYFGYAYYLDGAFKNYVFNNIAWGKGNDLGADPCNASGFMDIYGLNHLIFNNTFSRFGAGVRRQFSVMEQFTNEGRIPVKCVYTGNLWSDISDLFLDLDAWSAKARDPLRPPFDYGTFYFTRNALYGSPTHFARTEYGNPLCEGLPEFQGALRSRGAPFTDAARVLTANPLIDPARGDFRPKGGAGLAGMGARCFVPWGLSGVCGEWNFHPFAEGTNRVVMGEHMNFSDEHFDRYQYGQVPSNPLQCRGISREDFVPGILEDWAFDALRFDGRDAYCVLPDREIKRTVTYAVRGRGDLVYDGSRRKNLDMDTNNLLIELVFRAESAKGRGGVLVEKASREAGYRLRLDERGALALDLVASGTPYTVLSRDAWDDGAWHHGLVEVDRAAGAVRLYRDGKPAESVASGSFPARSLALSNASDFFVGRGTAGAYFKGSLDYLRVARGTLADAFTSIEELYAWEFQGPMLRDFAGRAPKGGARGAGAISGE
ncbi:MAG: LamG domain-containing protein [Spirochaetes bacterium]|nr:LamG domain-containing protein [Spirochaetota bacterium]